MLEAIPPVQVVAGTKRKRPAPNPQTPPPPHPYLSGNFAPIALTTPLTPCPYTGTIPPELAGGQYVRNGSNPVSNTDLARDAHWFDGDGMLAGVSFRRSGGQIVPEFVNQYILTDVYLSTLSSPRLRLPILPSIATLVNPLYGVLWVGLQVLRTLLLVLLSHLPGSKQKIKRISVANTSVVFHDGRALATCESGPMMRVMLPGLETLGWYNGSSAEGEPRAGLGEKEHVFGEGAGLLGWMREWTTAHPRVDPKTGEMIMFHSCFAPPYVQYSIIPPTAPVAEETTKLRATATTETEPPPEARGRMLNAAVPGIASLK